MQLLQLAVQVLHTSLHLLKPWLQEHKSSGLSQEDATTLTVQTIVGAAKLLDQSGKSATTLRENVTSPNGTTAAALASFGDDKLNSMVAKAMKAARDRSQELA